jgi:hypothetical protein
MRLALNIVAVIGLLLGGLWVLQGANIVGGSVMSGQSIWLYIGIVVVLLGLAILWRANRRR